MNDWLRRAPVADATGQMGNQPPSRVSPSQVGDGDGDVLHGIGLYFSIITQMENSRLQYFEFYFDFVAMEKSSRRSTASGSFTSSVLFIIWIRGLRFIIDHTMKAQDLKSSWPSCCNVSTRSARDLAIGSSHR